jgi:uncharacterized LabA/DUF88 family protein
MNDNLQSAMVYIDINNLFFMYKKLNFIKLAEYLCNMYNIIRFNAYNAIDHRIESQLKFNVYLSNNGYKVIDPDISVLTNCDNMIITDMVNDSNHFKHKDIVLISCDGGYTYTLNELSKRGYMIATIGVKEKTAASLVNVSDNIIYLEDIKGVIC